MRHHLISGLLGVFACARPSPPPIEVATPEPVTIEATKPRPQMALPDPEDVSLIGRWEGIGKQDDGPTWKMVLTINNLDVGKCATINYPTVPCAGHWECNKPSDGFVLEAVEIITEGRGLCHNNVPVAVRLARDRQSVAFAVEAGEASASANLRRAINP